jgi:hypothetical protein
VAASDCAMAAIEIVDGRVAHWKISFADTLADNGSAAFSCASETRRPGRGQGRRSRQRQLQLSVTRAMTNKKVAIIGSGNRNRLEDQDHCAFRTFSKCSIRRLRSGIGWPEARSALGVATTPTGDTMMSAGLPAPLSSTSHRPRSGLTSFRSTSWLIEQHGFIPPAAFRRQQLEPVALAEWASARCLSNRGQYTPGLA